MIKAEPTLEEVRHQLDGMVESRLLYGWSRDEHRRYAELIAVEALLLHRANDLVEQSTAFLLDAAVHSAL